ncbi:MAG: flavodoxin reductase [Calditrichaeota bacterium]|nr:flavodoxin reductase [Calditrichota bacterium]
MKKHIVKVLDTFMVTHDVKQIKVDKPAGFSFIPGQATEVSINKEGWKDEGRPFTFTNLPDEDVLEFTIKTYPEHKGVTNELLSLKAGDELILVDIFGEIAYKGKGVFIAGGAGITPFIAIFKQLKKNNELQGNKLIFANKSHKDIIYEDLLNSYLGDSFINILESGDEKEYYHGRISEDFLKNHIDDINGKFYLCGPPPMMNAVLKHLSNLGVKNSQIIQEAM